MTDTQSREDQGGHRLSEIRRIVVLIVVGALTSLLIADYVRVPTDPIQIGDVAPRTVKAPFSYSFQDPVAYTAARDRARESALPVFLYDEMMLSEVGGRLSAAFHDGREALDLAREAGDGEAGGGEVTDADAAAIVADFIRATGAPVGSAEVVPLVEAGFPAAAEALTMDWLESAYNEEMVLADRRHLPKDGRALRVVPMVSESEPFDLSDTRGLRSPDEVRREVTLAALSAKRREPWISSVEAIALSVVRPNLVYSADRTEVAREDAATSVVDMPIPVKRGETIFREGDKIDALHVVKYRRLQSSRTEHGVALELMAIFGFMMVVLGTLYGVTRRSFRKDPDDTRDLAATGLMLVLSAAMARTAVSLAPGLTLILGNELQLGSVWYMVPIAAGAMLARILMSRERAFFYTVSTAAAMAVLMRLEAIYVIYFLLAGLVSAELAGAVRERIQVLRAGFLTGVFCAVVALVLHFIQLYVGDAELSLAATIRPAWSALFALIGGLLSGVLVLALVPVFEQLGFTTDFKMLELASLNHPLMRQLLLRAPGTYHHSAIVGTLAEAACEAIGANSLQAKIAAYFHDIGKALKPAYFVENQRGGVNRHDDLDPLSSAAVIISHVTEGARLAREHKLPEPILDNIVMHHGTGLLQFFFAKAQMEAEDPASIDESMFRYPGPKPNTREAGVVMLADKVEAATRTIQNPNEENIRAMINRIINSVMADDQFSECPLTFREIYTIADTFVRVLLGIYHQRIEYPETRSISRSGAEEPRSIAGTPGTITLDLERPPVPGQMASSGLWNDAVLAEEEDYEAVRNLPQREDV